jgi:hypothetical protein
VRARTLLTLLVIYGGSFLFGYAITLNSERVGLVNHKIDPFQSERKGPAISHGISSTKNILVFDKSPRHSDCSSIDDIPSVVCGYGMRAEVNRLIWYQYKVGRLYILVTVGRFSEWITWREVFPQTNIEVIPSRYFHSVRFSFVLLDDSYVPSDRSSILHICSLANMEVDLCRKLRLVDFRIDLHFCQLATHNLPLTISKNCIDYRCERGECNEWFSSCAANHIAKRVEYVYNYNDQERQRAEQYHSYVGIGLIVCVFGLVFVEKGVQFIEHNRSRVLPILGFFLFMFGVFLLWRGGLYIL